MGTSHRQRAISTNGLCCGALPRVAILVMAFVVCLTLFQSGAEAAAGRTIIWARAGDALTLDPHAMNEGPTLTLLRQIYEPLVAVDQTGRLEPALATAWTMNGTVWRFTLRAGTRFHDGRPFTADDVVFSLERAMAPTSDMRALIAGIVKVEADGANSVRIETSAPDPLLPIQLSQIFIVSRAWADETGLTAPQRPGPGPDGSQVTIANGTGPFQLVRRRPGQDTDLSAFAPWWGYHGSKPAIVRIVYRPIKDPKARVEALISGAVDFLQDVPAQARAQLLKQAALRVNVGPDNRVIFLGLNVSASRRQTLSKADGDANPLHDGRVRQALDLAIDRTKIQRDVMQGQALPSGIIAPPLINGYPRDLDTVTKPDIEKAKALLKEAGFPDGFAITLNCPNDRYLNDAAICEEIAKQLSAIGVLVDVNAQPKRAHFDLVRRGGADLYLLGWGVPTFDSAYIFSNLFHTRTTTIGLWNGTGFGDPRIDAAIEGLSRETDLTRRAQTIRALWEKLQAAQIYLPIHIQTLSYAMSKDLDIGVDATNKPRLVNARLVQENPSEAKEAPPLR